MHEGCAIDHDEDPETIQRFDTKEAALESLKSFKTSIDLRKWAVSFFAVEEFYVEEAEIEVDEDGEETVSEVGDVWGITPMLLIRDRTGAPLLANPDDFDLDALEKAMPEALRKKVEAEKMERTRMDRIQRALDLDRSGDYCGEISALGLDPLDRG